ncbi:MAG: PAS domain S-box protein [Ignavibacteriae bacterium]|nr:PAS domain S-box protein [Ignavibacteriota bacterium]
MDTFKNLLKRIFTFLKRPHYKISLIYLFISILWIIYSDKITFEIFTTPESFKYIQSVKGLFFIFTTSIIIFLLIRNDYRTIKEKNNQLNDSKLKMQLAFDSSNMGTYQFDIKNNIVYFDEISQKIFGFNKSELNPEEIFNRIHPNDLQLVKDLLENIIGKGEEIKSYATYRIILDNNEIRWIDSSIILFSNDENNLSKINWGIGTFLDITEKKKSTEQLIILQYAIENANIGIFKIDEDGNINYANQYACDYLEYTKEEISNLNISDIDKSMTPERFKKHRNFVRENIYNTIETTHTRKDGTSFPVEVTVNYFTYENQLLAISFSKDITERKHADEKLRLSEERFKVVLRGADLGTWDWNVATNETNFNDRWAEMLGYTKNEISESYSSWTNLVHPDDLYFVDKVLKNHLNGLTEFYEAEYRMKHKNGKSIWILDKGKVVERDSNGNPKRLAGTHLDISARKEAEIELINTKNQLRALFANIDNIREDERKNLARELHDELGQVLTSLNMNLSLLKNNIDHNLYDEKLLLNDLDEMSQIVDTSKINIKKLIRSLRPEYLDNLGLVPALNHLVDEFKKNKKLIINFNFNFEEVNINSQKENIIYRVIQESLSNIVKHANASNVEVNLFLTEEKLNVLINDDGIGINTKDFKKENSFGIIGMKERLSQIGSELIIKSEENLGTSIIFEITL